MTQSRRQCALVAVLGVSLVLLSGCSGSRKNQIQETWLATVPWEKQGSVRQFQEAKQRAATGVAEATAQSEDAQSKLNTAVNQVGAAKLRRDAYEKLLEADRLTELKATIHQAELQLRAGEARLEVAEAQVEWCEENLGDWLARKQRWEAELQLADLQLNYARYQLLKAQGDSRVASLTDEDFQSDIAEAKDRAAEARSDAEEKRARAQQAHTQWKQRVEATRSQSAFSNGSVRR
jgi:chromosome segregation ATPase